jgi:hypothetical protein
MFGTVNDQFVTKEIKDGEKMQIRAELLIYKWSLHVEYFLTAPLVPQNCVLLKCGSYKLLLMTLLITSNVW